MHNEGLIVKGTNGVAAAGLVSFAWLPSLEQTAGVAGQLLPVLSAAWIAVQFAHFVWKWRREHNGK